MPDVFLLLYWAYAQKIPRSTAKRLDVQNFSRLSHHRGGCSGLCGASREFPVGGNSPRAPRSAAAGGHSLKRCPPPLRPVRFRPSFDPVAIFWRFTARKSGRGKLRCHGAGGRFDRLGVTAVGIVGARGGRDLRHYRRFAASGRCFASGRRRAGPHCAAGDPKLAGFSCQSSGACDC